MSSRPRGPDVVGPVGGFRIGFSEEVSLLCSMGFNSVQSLLAIESANGDLELAASILLSGSGQSVPTYLEPEPIYYPPAVPREPQVPRVVERPPVVEWGPGTKSTSTSVSNFQPYREGTTTNIPPKTGIRVPVTNTAIFEHEDGYEELLTHKETMMYHKTKRCTIQKYHEQMTCKFWHSCKDRRRNPYEVIYGAERCPLELQGEGRCTEVDMCIMSHNIIESMFHPEAYKVGLCKSLRGGQKCAREPSVCAFCHSNDDSRHPRFRHRKATAQHGQNTQAKGSQQKPSIANFSSGRTSAAAAVTGEPPRPPSSATTDYDDMSLPALKPISTTTTSTVHPNKQKNNGSGGVGVKSIAGGGGGGGTTTGTVKIMQRRDNPSEDGSDGWTQKQSGKVTQKSEDVRQEVGKGGGGGGKDFGGVGKDATTTTGARVHGRDSKSKTSNSNSNSNPANNRHQGFFAHLEEEDEGDVDDDDDGFTTVGGQVKKNGKITIGTTPNVGKKLHVATATATGTATGTEKGMATREQPAIATSQPPVPQTSSSLPDGGDAVTSTTTTNTATTTATVPVEYLCRLSKQLMNDPVICADGETYEKMAIEQWIADHNNMKKKLLSPVTGKEMPHPFLTPNFSIKTLIVAFRESN